MAVQNQLLFSLDAPYKPATSVFRKPEPILIERCYPSSVFTQQKSQTSPLQLSVVSEQSLAEAVQLAKRDVKKQKEKALLPTEQRTEKRPKANHCAIVHSSKYKERLQKRQQRNAQSKAIQTRVARHKSTRALPTATLHVNRSLDHLPARSLSPPTRDNHVEHSKQRHLPNVPHDIAKVQAEIQQCLQQIQRLAKTGVKTHSQMDADEERKERIRGEELSARLSRSVYMLSLRVRQLQQDVNQTLAACRNLSQSSKVYLLSSVGRAYHIALPLLQQLLQLIGLSGQLAAGMPHPYHMIITLLKQLSFCSVQLDGAESKMAQHFDFLKCLEDSSVDATIPEEQRLAAEQQTLCQQVLNGLLGEKKLGIGQMSKEPQTASVIPKMAKTKRTAASVPVASSSRSADTRLPGRQLAQASRKPRKGVLLRPARQPKESVVKTVVSSCGYAGPTISSAMKELPRQAKDVPSAPVQHRPSQSTSAVSPRHTHRMVNAAFQTHHVSGSIDSSPHSASSDDDQSLSDFHLPDDFATAPPLPRAVQHSNRTDADQAVLEVDSLCDELSDVVVLQQAKAMQQAPCLETMLQQLQKIEDEQNEIRRRWATATYEMDCSLPVGYTVLDTSDVACQPSAIKMTNSRKHTSTQACSQPAQLAEPGQLIIQPPVNPRRTCREQTAHPSIHIELAKDFVDKIHENRKQYCKQLAGQLYEEVGAFNPWQLVEQVSDEILNECFHDVAVELDAINSDIAEHVYRCEFASADTQADNKLWQSTPGARASKLTEETKTLAQSAPLPSQPV